MLPVAQSLILGQAARDILRGGLRCLAQRVLQVGVSHCFLVLVLNLLRRELLVVVAVRVLRVNLARNFWGELGADASFLFLLVLFFNAVAQAGFEVNSNRF